MYIDNIESYQDLQDKLRKHTSGKKVAEVELPESWFYKCIKLIQFFIKNNDNEKYRFSVLDIDNCREFKIKINGVFTKVSIK